VNLQAELLSADRKANDNFGQSVALSADGEFAIVGAPFATGTTAANTGAAYVFVRSGTTWVQQAKLLAADNAAGDYFGVSVALSADGSTALIGADQADGSGTINNGAAYVFTRTDGQWTQQAKFLAADAVSDDYFGVSVAISADGNSAVVGALFEDSNGAIANGAVYVFSRDGTAWTQQAKLLAADAVSDDYAGASVALSADSNTVLVGADGKSNGGLSRDGAAYGHNRPNFSPSPRLPIIVSEYRWLCPGMAVLRSLART
jgi:hypothetical protein